MRPVMRLDKWLVQARFFKTRTIALAEVEAGHVRVNGTKTRKPSSAVGAGDALTFPQGGRIRVIRVLDLPVRRGPASEAQELYQDLTDGVPSEVPEQE
ncbi:RNA-binding S4 domain-containing protein [Falsirhodobacter sp. 20TX0035]|uniref:RNA-binding S4 domain-containing protein n=1 Tax=Falsirhodobacter sp. 20TX0035 TaxID=3022019 RepID=UPI00232C023E|nr:RNA-binding S4 domain-containing protein [Falsirhodobacter sp. 20TX0035]MDB6452101.1 RNA-binding S4 domain-containing protein [Falsirhodobacter sp. 20TX0035]